MTRHHAWRLAGGASAIVAAAACAPEPTAVPPRAERASACATWAMPAYALRTDARTVYMVDGALRERPPAGALDTLDLRGLAAEALSRARDGDAATFEARDVASGAVLLRVTRGCVRW